MDKTIQIISDIHLEYNMFHVVEKHSDYLALLGDIGNPFEESYKNFLYINSKIFKKIFLINGNHELYSKIHNVDEIKNKIKEICKNIGNVFYLDKDFYDITDNTRIIGCTLWSNINKETVNHMNDFNYIRTNNRLINMSDYINWFSEDLLFIEKHLDESNKDVIVLTHHGPSYIMSGKFNGSKLQSGFISDLEYLFKKPLIAWASGHVHDNQDVLIKGIRSVSNAKGNIGEETGFKQNVIINFK